MNLLFDSESKEIILALELRLIKSLRLWFVFVFLGLFLLQSFLVLSLEDIKEEGPVDHMELFCVLELHWGTELELSLQRNSFIELKVEGEVKLLIIVDADFKISMIDGFYHHIKVGAICTFKSASFTLLFELIEVESLQPKISAVCHLDFTLAASTTTLLRLKVNDVLLPLMDDHCVEET